MEGKKESGLTVALVLLLIIAIAGIVIYTMKQKAAVTTAAGKSTTAIATPGGTPKITTPGVTVIGNQAQPLSNAANNANTAANVAAGVGGFLNVLGGIGGLFSGSGNSGTADVTSAASTIDSSLNDPAAVLDTTQTSDGTYDYSGFATDSDTLNSGSALDSMYS